MSLGGRRHSDKLGSRLHRGSDWGDNAHHHDSRGRDQAVSMGRGRHIQIIYAKG